MDKAAINIAKLEEYRNLLEERHRLLMILENDPDDDNTFDLLVEVCRSIEDLSIRHWVPSDLRYTQAIDELIEILQNKEADCIQSALEYWYVKKLRSHFK